MHFAFLLSFCMEFGLARPPSNLLQLPIPI